MRTDRIVVGARMAQLLDEADEARLGHRASRAIRHDELAVVLGARRHRGPIAQARRWTGRRLVRLGLAMLDARTDRGVVATSSSGLRSR